MDIFQRFRQHYARYFLGVIIPAFVNGLSVPLLKQALGTKLYGQYALYFNAMLLANLLLSGWLWQAILRFAARFTDKNTFAVAVFRLSLLLPLLAFVPAASIVGCRSGDILLGLLFAATLLAAGLQLPKQALTQAYFQSRLMVQSEAVRMVSWLGSIGFLIALKLLSLPTLFAALFVSYSLSTIYLYFRSPLPGKALPAIPLRLLLKEALPLLRYGLPFSLWYVFFYGITYLDKVVMLRQFGPTLQGDYNALFDFTSKGLVLLLAPVVTSAMPLLAEAYEKGKQQAANRLLRKLIGYELIAMAICLLAYGLLGCRPLFWLLKIGYSQVYLQMGLLIIAGTFLWQIAVLLQKKFELRLQSKLLLAGIAISFLGQWLFYLSGAVVSPNWVVWGYCLPAVIYLLLLVVAAKFFKKKSSLPAAN